MSAKISPLAPRQFPNLPPIAGIELATRACGIRYRGRDDVLLLVAAPGTQAAGVFTRSLTASAPVLACRRHLAGGKARAILVNAGNANAFTGKAGERAVKDCLAAAARAIGCPMRQIFVASTGVIGEPLPAEKIIAGLPHLLAAGNGDRWREAAQAIMTTDTFPKMATRRARIGDAEVTINGIAKGSGMIAPDMATMLAFVATDARIPSAILQRLLSEGNRRSFNCLTVDGDTSTSDTLLMLASGAGPRHPLPQRPGDPLLKDFRRALFELLTELAILVAKDGEGAEKLVTIDVTGAAGREAARRVGLAIANSPLVKTAIAGGDANWGRIVMAVGKSGEKADRDRLAISIGGTAITAKGERRPDYDEAPVVAHIRGRDVRIAVDLGIGRGAARIWTCDLTHGYIDINADYRS